jgi:hypothetical protein
MAFNPAPTSFFANWSEDGANITLPIASVPELTAAEADATTGDIRKVLFAIIERAAVAYAALAAADKPGKMAIDRSNFLRSDGNIDRTFTVTFTLAPASIDVADEA